MANFLVHQKGFHVCPLITRQLNDLANLVILLYGTIATEILLEGLANSLHVQVVCQACYRRNTFSSISLLDTNVNLFFAGASGLVSGVLKGIYYDTSSSKTQNRKEQNKTR
jgi:hypothetical protein